MDAIPLWAFYLAATVIGLELGGVSTIFIQRWIDGQPILRPGRSRCPSCEEKLDWRDTVPLLGFFLLRGRCRHCGEAIGVQYVLAEIACMAWALAAAHRFGMTPDWGVHLVLGTMLIAGSLIDFETFMLPESITLGGTALALAASFLPDSGPHWQDALLGAASGAGFFWVLQQFYRLWRKEEGLGTGDIKLMAMIGAMTGLAGLPMTILVSTVTGAVGSVFYMVRPGKHGVRGHVPYGPFLSLGCMLYVLYGPQLMRWWNS